ncbi:MAG: hypothetical protein ABFE08_23985 [Armatimonadia bacterium]
MQIRRTIWVAALMCGLCHCGLVTAQEQAKQVICGGLLRVRVPEGWTLKEINPTAALLQSENPEQRIEVIAWDAPAEGDLSAAAAANAQETALYRRVPYVRRKAEVFRTEAGLEGLAVTGQVRPPEGQLGDSIFIAFALGHEGDGGRKYCVIGMFGAAGEAGKLLEGPLGQVARTLEVVHPETPAQEQLAAKPVPVPAPKPKPPLPVAVVDKPVELPVAPPPAVPTPPATDKPGLAPASPAGVAVTTAPAVADEPKADKAPEKVAPPAVKDVVPVPEPEDAQLKLVPFESPLGFKLQYPVGWQVLVREGHIEVTSAAGDGSSAPGAVALIWPLIGVEGADAASLAKELLERLELTAVGARGLGVRQQDDLAVLAGTVGTGKGSRRVVACSHVRGDSGLLSALVARPDEFDKHLPALLGILDSFEAGPWWTTVARQSDKTVMWQDPGQGVMQAPVPAGWKVRGGVQPFNGIWTLFVEATSQDERRLSVLWQQPLVPLFRELTPVLRNLGWQEGDKYLANPGDQQLRILSRLSPQDFLTKYWLTTPAQRLESAVLEKVEGKPEAATLTAGDKAAGIVVTLRGELDGKPRQRMCVVATADAPVRIGANCWQAGMLQCEAPAGALEEALGVLRAMITGAEVTPGATHPAAASGVQALIAGAKQAIEALPPAPRGPVGRDVLAGLNERGQGDLWMLSPAAMEPWRKAAVRAGLEGSLGEALPELGQEFWK